MFRKIMPTFRQINRTPHEGWDNLRFSPDLVSLFKVLATDDEPINPAENDRFCTLKSEFGLERTFRTTTPARRLV